MKKITIDGQDYELKPIIEAKRPDWKWEVVVIGDGKLEVIYDNPKKDWLPSDDERMYIYHAIEWLLRTIQYEDDWKDYLDGRSSVDEAIAKAHNLIGRKK